MPEGEGAVPDSQAGKAVSASSSTGLTASERAELERLKAEVSALRIGDEHQRRIDGRDPRKNGAVALALLLLVVVTAGLAVLLTELSVPLAPVWSSIVLGIPTLYLGWKTLQPPPNATATSVSERSWRGITTWRELVMRLLIGVGCMLAPVSILAVWTANEVSNTDRYVATVEPLIHDTAIQNALTNKITTAITAHLKVVGYTGFVHTQTHKIVTSPQAVNLWIQINRTAHDQLVKVLSGQDNSALTTSNLQVTLDLGPFINVIKQDLARRGITAIAKLPPVHPTIALYSSKNLVKAQALYELINVLKIVLPILSLLLIAAGVYIARDHRRAIIGAGFGFAGSMLVLGGLLPVVRGVYINSAPAALAFDVMVRDVKEALRTLLVVGLVVAAGAFLTGPSVTAVRTRAGFRSAFDWIRSRSFSTGPAGRWTYSHRHTLRICAVSLAAIIFVFQGRPSAGSVILLVIVLLVVLALIELIGRPPTRSEIESGRFDRQLG